MDELILSAISSKHILRFTYQGAKRTCEPHVFGYANGQKQLLCYQLSGGSQRGGIPEWRRFEVAGIKNMKISKRTFPGKRITPYPFSLGWDQIVSVV